MHQRPGTTPELFFSTLVLGGVVGIFVSPSIGPIPMTILTCGLGWMMADNWDGFFSFPIAGAVLGGLIMAVAGAMKAQEKAKQGTGLDGPHTGTD